MELYKTLSFLIDGKIFLFRSLTEEDVTQSYVEALRRQQMFLTNNPADIDVLWQKDYIRKIHASQWDAICGLYEGKSLLGTAGVQSIKPGTETTIGMFVLHPESRGRGYGKLLVWSSCFLINRLFGIEDFAAMAKKSNIASWKAFLACGFQIARETDDAYRLALGISELRVPDGVEEVTIG